MHGLVWLEVTMIDIDEWWQMEHNHQNYPPCHRFLLGIYLVKQLTQCWHENQEF